MRLLDIDKVIEALQEPYNNGTYRGVDYDQTDAAAFEEALEAAYKEYGIEAEPVRRGRWLTEYGDHIHAGLRPMFICCSECGMVNTVKWNYCPNCGAKMEKQNKRMDDLISRQAAIDALENTKEVAR